MSRRRPHRDEQAETARLFAPPEQGAQRVTLWERMAHRQETCDPTTCPLCQGPVGLSTDAEGTA